MKYCATSSWACELCGQTLIASLKARGWVKAVLSIADPWTATRLGQEICSVSWNDESYPFHSSRSLLRFIGPFAATFAIKRLSILI